MQVSFTRPTLLGVGTGRCALMNNKNGSRSSLLRRSRLGCTVTYAKMHFREGEEEHEHAPASIFNSGKPADRLVADTSDEESNLPDNPLGLDEDIIIPQRPSIRDVYREVRHDFAEHSFEGERVVADTSDEESNLPGDPVDLDEEMMIPQKPFIRDVYDELPGSRRRSHGGQQQQQQTTGGSGAVDPQVASLNSEDIEVADELASAFRFEGAGQAARELKEEHDHPDPAKKSDHIVSGLPPPDPNASSVASLNSEDIEVAEELAASFRFEGAGEAAKELKEEHDHPEGHGKGRSEGGLDDEKSSSKPIPGSHESPRPLPPQHGQREERMEQAEKDVTQQAQHAAPRHRPDLPGLITEDTTFINPSSAPHAESGVEETQERVQGILEGIDKITEDEKYRHSQPESLSDAVSSDPSSDASMVAMEGEESQQGLMGGGGGGGPEEEAGAELRLVQPALLDEDEKESLSILDFNFKSDKDNAPQSSSSKRGPQDILRSVAAKAASAGQELDPLAKLTAARQAYRQHRTLTEESLRQSKPRITVARIVEVSAGRAAVVGCVSALLSEILFGQSVLSQLFGRWEGPRQVEFVVQNSRTAALAVLALSFAVTAIEVIVAGVPPPSGRRFGLSPGMQLWGGRLAMGMFLGICLYETMHSNRPVFPFWYILK